MGILVQSTDKKIWQERGKYHNYTPLGYFEHNSRLEAIMDESNWVQLTDELLEELIEEETNDDVWESWLIAVFNTRKEGDIIIMDRIEN